MLNVLDPIGTAAVTFQRRQVGDYGNLGNQIITSCLSSDRIIRTIVHTVLLRTAVDDKNLLRLLSDMIIVAAPRACFVTLLWMVLIFW